jgi:hypothetical protein
MTVIIVLAGLVALGAFIEAIRIKPVWARMVSVLVVSAVFGLFIWGCVAYQHHEQAKEEAKWRAKRKEVEDAIATFAARYNAVADWQKSLRSQNPGGTIYTAQVAPVLVRSDARPMLFLASVRDVVKEEGRFVLLFDGRVSLGSRFLLRLDASTDEANLAMSHRRNDPADRFAVVATITSVDSSTMAVHDEAGTEQKPVSQASGRCVDLMPIGSYWGDILEMVSQRSPNSSEN